MKYIKALKYLLIVYWCQK